MILKPQNMKKAVRSYSGVLIVTVVMDANQFSCSHDCHYCPNEPGVTRSYLSTEPAILRAAGVGYDTKKQVHTRFEQLSSIGHTLDKIEIIVLGGTWSEHKKSYRDQFITDLFYAANTYSDQVDRPCMGLSTEQKYNVTSAHKIIGISIETRPDSISKYEIRRLRIYGVTRVQLGIQHTDDALLSFVNRGHTAADGVRGIALLKKNGFKVDCHVMPDLPNATPEGDMEMLKTVILSPSYIPDMLKIYPTLDVAYTEIRKWKETGSWKPYAETHFHKLIDVIMCAKKICPEFIRFNRIQRDFPEESETRVGFISEFIRPNLRQMVQNECKKQNIFCKCIRCREIKNTSYGRVRYKLTSYRASEGIEYFISAVTENERLLGFVRLRINDTDDDVYFNELKNTGIIRELHVYGFISATTSVTSTVRHVQHTGIGKSLVMMAGLVTRYNHKPRMTVIAGVGTRDYYKKFGFELKKPYGYMTLKMDWLKCIEFIYLLFIYFLIYITKTPMTRWFNTRRG